MPVTCPTCRQVITSSVGVCNDCGVLVPFPDEYRETYGPGPYTGDDQEDLGE